MMNDVTSIKLAIVWSVGRSVIRKRISLYDISEGAGRMIFCLMALLIAVPRAQSTAKAPANASTKSVGSVECARISETAAGGALPGPFVDRKFAKATTNQPTYRKYSTKKNRCSVYARGLVALSCLSPEGPEKLSILRMNWRWRHDKDETIPMTANNQCNSEHPLMSEEHPLVF